jgi:hypothetical protein
MSLLRSRLGAVAVATAALAVSLALVTPGSASALTIKADRYRVIQLGHFHTAGHGRGSASALRKTRCACGVLSRGLRVRPRLFLTLPSAGSCFLTPAGRAGSVSNRAKSRRGRGA